MKSYWKLSIRLLFCIVIAGFVLYFYIENQNELTLLRLAIPVEVKALKVIQEQNVRLKYLIDCFETPTHLMELAQKPEYAHLKHPYTKDVIKLPGRLPLTCIECDEFSDRER
ncbi:MAG: hypothetical protein H0U49_02135 [Parachlamydiaceae bacterium]|nr:hypothetical protein [Parachlamydiaceae bacterium]